ncbi:hypothetical protein BWQ96_02207 [Gracilariopsis chorda]|uniref:Uncharacterized protein n=1 Tax=Gracilariopsis chorda TaxID=448386 RepID=A0A2V3J0S8_9FLOR|nr:hypothetical protein BWQ96_02207 [Gracilariopsis chorda]|eukprot:PXF48016.1 hypothetical protein BWQ96_02207 [Gracilariopsis chorda]
MGRKSEIGVVAGALRSVRCEQDFSEVECENSEDENLDEKEELRMNYSEAHVISDLEELNDDECPSNPEIDMNTTLESAKEEFFQHAEMIATL